MFNRAVFGRAAASLATKVTTTLATTRPPEGTTRTRVTAPAAAPAVATVPLCALCGDLLSAVVEDYGRGCCRGCADLMTVYYHPDRRPCRSPAALSDATGTGSGKAPEWVEVRPEHVDQVRAAITTHTYAGYSPERGVSVAPPA